MLKNRPCAYCGTTNLPRTRGHVLPRRLYRDNMPNAKRITVAECEKCKRLWEDAEPHFRNILLAIWNSDALPADSRVESMRRSFLEPDGRRRARELYALIKRSPAAPGRELIDPTKNEPFNLILRRIVRGLAAKNGVGYAIPDESVECGVMHWEVPPAFEPEIRWDVIECDFYSPGGRLDSVTNLNEVVPKVDVSKCTVPIPAFAPTT